MNAAHHMACPHCGELVPYPASLAGTEVLCPKCRGLVRLRSAEPVADSAAVTVAKAAQPYVSWLERNLVQEVGWVLPILAFVGAFLLWVTAGFWPAVMLLVVFYLARIDNRLGKWRP
jgi:uncharacterized paraquat-inducible protein A